MLDADSIENQPAEFVGQLKNLEGVNPGVTQPVFALTSLEKIKETRLRFSQGSVMVL